MYMTDNDLLKKTQVLALVCLGGMAENFDYSRERERLNRWGQIRKEFGFRGGFVPKSLSDWADMKAS